MSSLRNDQILLAMVVIVFAGAFVWLVTVVNVNNDLRRDLNYERLRNESLLSEKLLIEKSMIEAQQVLRNVVDSLTFSSDISPVYATRTAPSTAELQFQITAALNRLQSVSGSKAGSAYTVE